MTSEEATEVVHARISKDTIGADPSVFQNLVENVYKASKMLEKSGALYAGTCIRTYDEELSIGTLLVTVTSFEFGDAMVAANGIVRALTAGRGESWAGSVFDTHNGPMAVVSGMKSLQIPAETSQLSEDLEFPMAEIQAFLPVPQGSEIQQQCLVCVNFTTPCEDHWDEYCNDMADFMRSITFDESPSVRHDTSTHGEGTGTPAPTPPESGAGTLHAESEGPATPFG